MYFLMIFYIRSREKRLNNSTVYIKFVIILSQFILRIDFIKYIVLSKMYMRINNHILSSSYNLLSSLIHYFLVFFLATDFPISCTYQQNNHNQCSFYNALYACVCTHQLYT